jgi:hypothetical protein
VNFVDDRWVDGWERLDDAGLEQLLQQATLRGRPRRLIE